MYTHIHNRGSLTPKRVAFDWLEILLDPYNLRQLCKFLTGVQDFWHKTSRTWGPFSGSLDN